MLLFEICEAWVSDKAFTCYSIIFFLTRGLPVLHCKFSKCPFTILLYHLGSFFQLFPEIKKRYLMNTLEALFVFVFVFSLTSLFISSKICK